MKHRRRNFSRQIGRDTANVRLALPSYPNMNCKHSTRRLVAFMLILFCAVIIDASQDETDATNRSLQDFVDVNNVTIADDDMRRSYFCGTRWVEYILFVAVSLSLTECKLSVFTQLVRLGNTLAGLMPAINVVHGVLIKASWFLFIYKKYTKVCSYESLF